MKEQSEQVSAAISVPELTDRLSPAPDHFRYLLQVIGHELYIGDWYYGQGEPDARWYWDAVSMLFSRWTGRIGEIDIPVFLAWCISASYIIWITCRAVIRARPKRISPLAPKPCPDGEKTLQIRLKSAVLGLPMGITTLTSFILARKLVLTRRIRSLALSLLSLYSK